MSTPGAWDVQQHLLLPHPSEVQVLALRGPDGWELPHFMWQQRDAELEPLRLRQLLRARLDIDATLLRPVHIELDAATRTSVALLEQVRNWSLSCILRIAPPGGGV